MSRLRKAERGIIRLRKAILGPAGSGKTYTALVTAKAIAEKYGQRIAVIDTEAHDGQGSSEKYADRFDFDVVVLDKDQSVESYIAALDEIAAAGVESGIPYVCIIDSLSHAWAGKGGILDFVDAKTMSSHTKNSFMAWREASPLHNKLVSNMLSYPGHLIATMRVKMTYEVVENERGKRVPMKIGLQPVQRDGLEYEFDILADMDVDNRLVVSKTRYSDLSGKVFLRPDKEYTGYILNWIGDAPNSKILEQPEKPDPAEDREKVLAACRTALGYMSSNKVDGFDSGLRRNNSLRKHLGIDNIDGLEGVSTERIHEYTDYLRQKAKAAKEEKGAA